MAQLERVDAVIIGMGAAGGVLAKELTQAGMKVVALERGAFRPVDEMRHMDELRFSVRGGLSANANQPSTVRPVS
jgi:gluconate 2-dehydrogenase alpha chain